MSNLSQYKIRTATLNDRQRLAHLTHFEGYVHRHLDYRPALDWLGNSPFLVLAQKDNIAGVIACPPDPPHVAWLRLFAVSKLAILEEAWALLWKHALDEVNLIPGIECIAVIPQHRWFIELLEQSKFQYSNSIIGFNLDESDENLFQIHKNINLRAMKAEDLLEVSLIDQSAFSSIWQNSLESLNLAFQQSSISTVALSNNKIIGYQISTLTSIGTHLARLAVLPSYQGKGVGKTLLNDLIKKSISMGAKTISVNTQKENLASIELYTKFGFKTTGEEFPVYIKMIRNFIQSI